MYSRLLKLIHKTSREYLKDDMESLYTQFLISRQEQQVDGGGHTRQQGRSQQQQHGQSSSMHIGLQGVGQTGDVLIRMYGGGFDDEEEDGNDDD